MILRNRFTSLSLILIIGVLLSGCSLTGQTAVPTVDPKALQATVDAAVARSMQTEAFNLTSTAAALPTNTFTVTATLAPLATATPKATATTAATATAAATHPAPTATKALIVSTKKPTATATPAAYVCKLVSTTPAKGTKIDINTDFDAVWKVKNVGIKDWQVGYVDLKYISGTKMQTASDLFDVKTAVMKGEELVLTVDMKAPTTAGKFTDTFALMMEGTTMCTLPVTIEAVTP